MVPGRRCIQKKYIPLRISPYTGQIRCVADNKNLFILVSLNISLHIYPLTLLLTILDSVRVLPISSMYQNFNPQFTSPLSSLASVLPLMPPLFGIHSLKTSVHHPLWPLLERSSKPISTQRLILLSSLFLWFLCGADLFFVPGL